MQNNPIWDAFNNVRWELLSPATATVTESAAYATNDRGDGITIAVPSRQAIVTKYHGPTNTRGSRISAQSAGGRVSVSYDHELTSGQNHAKAAATLAAKLGWSGRMVGGGSPDSTGSIFVFVA